MSTVGTVRGSIAWGPNEELAGIPDRNRVDGIHHDWFCRCGEPLVVIWSASCAFGYDVVDEPITPDQAITSHWWVECHNGHRLLWSYELADDTTADTFDPPTTGMVVAALATPDEIMRWGADVAANHVDEFDQ